MLGIASSPSPCVQQFINSRCSLSGWSFFTSCLFCDLSSWETFNHFSCRGYKSTSIYEAMHHDDISLFLILFEKFKEDLVRRIALFQSVIVFFFFFRFSLMTLSGWYVCFLLFNYSVSRVHEFLQVSWRFEKRRWRSCWWRASCSCWQRSWTPVAPSSCPNSTRRTASACSCLPRPTPALNFSAVHTSSSPYVLGEFFLRMKKYACDLSEFSLSILFYLFIYFYKI